MANNKWKRILSLVMSLLMMLPGAAFADETGVPYSAEDHALLTGYVELLSDGFGLNEMEADYAKAIENVVREEIGGQNADGGLLWYAADPMTGWGVENTLEYSFEGGSAEGLAEISLRVERGADGSALVIALGEGEEVSLPMSNLSGQLDVYAYAVGTEEEPKLMVGAIGAWDFSNAVILARDGETGAWEIEMQVTTEGDAVLLNGDVAHAQVDTDGTIWLDGDNGASIVFISGGESRICRIDEYGEMISEEVAPADADDPAAGREDLADALRLAARCSIIWGKSGEDSVSLQDMIDNAVCVLCGGKGQHLAHPCGAHCILEEGDHGHCEICGEPLCVSDNHGTAEGECGYITAGPSKAPGVEPTPAPTVKPTVRPTAKPTEEPGVEAPSLPMEGVCPVCRQPDNGVSHQAECGHFTCAADWGDIRHGYRCPGCGLLSCSEEYLASGKNHVACPGCGIYDCLEEYGEFSHPACAKCGAYFCVEDERDHSYCPGCGMFACEEGYNKDITHKACPGCGAWNCMVDMTLINHGICPCCGIYACEDGYVIDEHSMCMGCGMYLCDPNYAAEEHKDCACGMKVCDADYIPEKHTVCEACGEMLCNGEDHSQASCGFSGHYVCVGKHGQCPKCGGLQCDGNGHVPCPNPRCDAYSCDDDYAPEEHAVFDCGKHFVCDYSFESDAPDPIFHAKANCGVHYQCEDGIHETCGGCGVYLCGEGIDLAEHEWCDNCEVYFCEEEYAHIIHHYYDDGDCRCTLKHDKQSARPYAVGEEGVRAHFALDCCGMCSMHSEPGKHGLPADCGKEGHVKCIGRHDACDGCGMFACDERYVSGEHIKCFECWERVCNGADHTARDCGHYKCVSPQPGEEHLTHTSVTCEGCGESYLDCSAESADHAVCENCGAHICDGNYTHGDSGLCFCWISHEDPTATYAVIGPEGAAAHYEVHCSACGSTYCASVGIHEYGCGQQHFACEPVSSTGPGQFDHVMKTCGGCGTEYLGCGPLRYEHGFCSRCGVYRCDTPDIDHGSVCFCTLAHANGYGANVGSGEGSAHYAVICEGCGTTHCASDPGKHRKCTVYGCKNTSVPYLCGGLHDQLENCEHRECDPSHVPTDCPGCGEEYCISYPGKHVGAECGENNHFSCVGNHGYLACNIHRVCAPSSSTNPGPEPELHEECPGGCGRYMCDVEYMMHLDHHALLPCGNYVCMTDHERADCGHHCVCQPGDHSAAGCGESGHYNCDGFRHAFTKCYDTECANRCVQYCASGCDGYYCIEHTGTSNHVCIPATPFG